MKYFSEGNTETGYGEKGIILHDQIFSIRKDGENIVFMEECDGFFHESFSKIEAVELLQEAIDWIESDTDKKPT